MEGMTENTYASLQKRRTPRRRRADPDTFRSMKCLEIRPVSTACNRSIAVLAPSRAPPANPFEVGVSFFRSPLPPPRHEDHDHHDHRRDIMIVVLVPGSDSWSLSYQVMIYRSWSMIMAIYDGNTNRSQSYQGEGPRSSEESYHS